MDATPPPEKPHVIYVVPQAAPTPLRRPKPTAMPHGSKTVNEFIRHLDTKARAAQPKPSLQIPVGPVPTFRDNMPRFGDDVPGFVPVQAPQGRPSMNDVAATAGAFLGLGIFAALVWSAFCCMFVGFFVYMGVAMARALLRALIGHYSPNDRRRNLPDELVLRRIEPPQSTTPNR